MRFQTRPVKHASDVVWNHVALRVTVVSGMDVVTLESCHFEPYGSYAKRTLSSQRRGITGLLRLWVTPFGTSLQPTPVEPGSRSGGAVLTDNLSLSGRTDPRWMWRDLRAAVGSRYRDHPTILSPFEAQRCRSRSFHRGPCWLLFVSFALSDWTDFYPCK